MTFNFDIVRHVFLRYRPSFHIVITGSRRSYTIVGFLILCGSLSGFHLIVDGIFGSSWIIFA